MTRVAVVTLLVVRHLATILCLNCKHHQKASLDGAVQAETDESYAASEQALVGLRSILRDCFMGHDNPLLRRGWANVYNVE